LFEVEKDTQVKGDCHWQADPRKHPTMTVLHGLEGSSDSAYMLGTAEKAWVAGFNVVRLNQRNCGGTEELTPTLYHSGLSGDIRSVVMELITCDGLPEIFPVGFSMGGNLVLKMAGEAGDRTPPEVRGFAVVAPSHDLRACADALERPRNFIFEEHFVRRLKARMRRKAKLFPDIYSARERPVKDMRDVKSVRQFDEDITARYCGFLGAEDYYARSSANQFIAEIRRPTLILTAQDDPVVPFSSFELAAIRENPLITFVAPRHGGHCAFIAADRERFWAEALLVEFCTSHSEILSESRDHEG